MFPNKFISFSVPCKNCCSGNKAEITLDSLISFDIEVWYKWFNDPDVVKYSVHKSNTLRPENKNTYDKQLCFFRQLRLDREKIQYAIRCDSKLIGVVSLTCVNKKSSVYSIEIIIGNKNYWNRGIGQSVIKEIVSVAKGLGYRKIVAGASSENVASIRAFEKSGFEREGILRKQLLIGAEYHDIVCLAKFV